MRFPNTERERERERERESTYNVSLSLWGANLRTRIPQIIYIYIKLSFTHCLSVGLLLYATEISEGK